MTREGASGSWSTWSVRPWRRKGLGISPDSSRRFPNMSKNVDPPTHRRRHRPRLDAQVNCKFQLAPVSMFLLIAPRYSSAQLAVLDLMVACKTSRINEIACTYRTRLTLSALCKNSKSSELLGGCYMSGVLPCRVYCRRASMFHVKSNCVLRRRATIPRSIDRHPY